MLGQHSQALGGILGCPVQGQQLELMIQAGPFQLQMFHDSETLTGAFQLWIFHDSGGLATSGQLGHQDFGISGIFLGCPVQGQELDLRILVRPFQSGHSTFPRACSLVFQEQQHCPSQGGFQVGSIIHLCWSR